MRGAGLDEAETGAVLGSLVAAWRRRGSGILHQLKTYLGRRARLTKSASVTGTFLVSLKQPEPVFWIKTLDPDLKCGSRRPLNPDPDLDPEH